MVDIEFDKEAALRILRHTAKIKTAIVGASSVGGSGPRADSQPTPSQGGSAMTLGGSGNIAPHIDAMTRLFKMRGVSSNASKPMAQNINTAAKKQNPVGGMGSGLPKTAMAHYGAFLEKTANKTKGLSGAAKLFQRAGPAIDAYRKAPKGQGLSQAWKTLTDAAPRVKPPTTPTAPPYTGGPTTGFPGQTLAKPPTTTPQPNMTPINQGGVSSAAPKFTPRPPTAQATPQQTAAAGVKPSGATTTVKPAPSKPTNKTKPVHGGRPDTPPANPPEPKKWPEGHGPAPKTKAEELAESLNQYASGIPKNYTRAPDQSSLMNWKTWLDPKKLTSRGTGRGQNIYTSTKPHPETKEYTKIIPTTPEGRAWTRRGARKKAPEGFKPDTHWARTGGPLAQTLKGGALGAAGAGAGFYGHSYTPTDLGGQGLPKGTPLIGGEGPAPWDPKRLARGGYGAAMGASYLGPQAIPTLGMQVSGYRDYHPGLRAGGYLSGISEQTPKDAKRNADRTKFIGPRPPGLSDKAWDYQKNSRGATWDKNNPAVGTDWQGNFRAKHQGNLK